jgi:uncharacterized delta-60 repeat protein
MALQPDGKLIVVGSFTTYNGSTASGIARLNTDGSLDQTFNTGTGFLNPNGEVDVVISPDGSIYIGGNMTSFNGQAVSGLVRLSSSGSLDTTFSTNLKSIVGHVHDIAVLGNGGEVVFGGSIQGIRGVTPAVPVTGVSWASNFSTYTATSHGLQTGDLVQVTGVAPSAYNRVDTVTVIDPNTFRLNKATVTGGSYSSGGQVEKLVPLGNIAKVSSSGVMDAGFNTRIGTGFSSSPGPLSQVYGLALQSSGGIVVAGSFNRLNGIAIPPGISLIATDGTPSPTTPGSFHANAGGANNFSGFGGFPNDLVQDAQGKLVLAGPFSSFNGTFSLPGIVRLNADGSRDTTFVVGTGTYQTPYNQGLSVTSEGQVIALHIRAYGGVSVPSGVVRLTNTGSLDQAFRIPLTSVNSSTVLSAPNGDVYLAGSFTSFDGKAVGRIVRLTYLAPTVESPAPVTPSAAAPASTTPASTTPASGLKLAATGTDLAPILPGVASALLIFGLMFLVASKRLRRKN